MDLSSGMDLLILWALLGGGGAAVSGAAGKAGEKAPGAAEAGAGEAAAAGPAEGAAAGSASVRGEEDAGGGARDDWDALAVGPVASVDEVTAEEWDACARPDEPGACVRRATLRPSRRWVGRSDSQRALQLLSTRSLSHTPSWAG